MKELIICLLISLILCTTDDVLLKSTIYPEGCETFLDEVGCTKCKNGYVLKDRECLETKGCSDSKENVGCTSCKIGYYLMKNECLIKPDSCSNTEDNVGCTSCK